jgi:phosphohistidine phosphatase
MVLFFLRHGLADRAAWDGPDELRPLTPEGKERMAAEAAAMKAFGLDLDLILTSPLTRAYQTAEIAASLIPSQNGVAVDDRLRPGFGIATLAAILVDYSDLDNLMVVGHEPDFSEVIGSLIGGGQVNVKKGSLARVDLYNSAPPQGELMWLIPPKLLAPK